MRIFVRHSLLLCSNMTGSMISNNTAFFSSADNHPCGGSIQAVADAMYIHRNTILYRMNNIRRLLGSSLETQEERLPYQIACLIRHMFSAPEQWFQA